MREKLWQNLGEGTDGEDKGCALKDAREVRRYIICQFSVIWTAIARKCDCCWWNGDFVVLLKNRMHVYMFELYNSYQLLDEDSTGWNIYMFRTHYDSFYANLTFPKEAR